MHYTYEYDSNSEDESILINKTSNLYYQRQYNEQHEEQYNEQFKDQYNEQYEDRCVAALDIDCFYGNILHNNIIIICNIIIL